MMKFWIYENHICELQSEELNEGRSSQLYTQTYKPEFFQAFFLATAKVAYITAMIILHLIVFGGAK